MPYTDREVREQVYQVIAAKLRSESLCDIDDPEFIDRAWPIQNEIADQFEKKANALRLRR